MISLKKGDPLNLERYNKAKTSLRLDGPKYREKTLENRLIKSIKLVNLELDYVLPFLMEFVHVLS
jgi:hypothetical protein